MTVTRINETQYANIYGVYDPTGKLIGTVEVVLAGRNVGTFCYSMTGKYNKRDIRRFYADAMRG